MSRILYFSPDFPQPSGGIKTLYRHVYRLRKAGFDAAIVHQKRGFHANWHHFDVPVIWLEDRPQLSTADVLVFPEVMADMVRQTRQMGERRVVIALSWAPAYNRLQPGESWSDLGVRHILAKSPTVARILTWQMGARVTLIPECIDPDLYYVEEQAKDRRIVYMTRKDKSGEWLRGALTRKGDPFSTYEWTPLRNMNEDVYAAHLRRAALYLPTTLQESMHVSSLEAMACGCLVVGYTGIGGGDFMVGSGDNQNAILVENGNLHALGLELERTLSAYHSDPARFAMIRDNALATAARYRDVEAETTALSEFFGALVE